jgi:hypothetical protein
MNDPLADKRLAEIEDMTQRVKLRPAVLRFAREMERKLRANDHKGGWDNCTLNYLSTRLTQERKELMMAMGSGKNDAALREAADCANFLMMMVLDERGETHD